MGIRDPQSRSLRNLAASAALALVSLLAGAPAVNAALIAAWNFDDGTASDVSGNPPAYDLSPVALGPDMSLGFARFDGNDASPSYLEATGPGGMSQYTVSLWVRPQSALDQGQYQGIFSNNTPSSAAWSWQIENFDGTYQWRTQAGTFVIGAPTGVGAWDHIVVRKIGGNDGDIWLNGVQVVSNLGGNPGGLQMFRLGTNRNSGNLYEADLEDVQVFDSLEDPSLLYFPSIPEPSSGALLLLGLTGLAAWRRAA